MSSNGRLSRRRDWLILSLTTIVSVATLLIAGPLWRRHGVVALVLVPAALYLTRGNSPALHGELP